MKNRKKWKTQTAVMLTASLVLGLLFPAVGQKEAKIDSLVKTAEASESINGVEISNPVVEDHIAMWDTVYFGNYWQNIYEPTNVPANPEVGGIYTDSNGTRFKYCKLRSKYLTVDIGDGEKDYEYYYYYCKYEPIKWRVLSIDSEGNALLLADKILDCQAFVQPEDEEEESIEESTIKATWKTSNVRSWLNGLGDAATDNFLSVAFTEAEKSAIKTTDVVCSNENNPMKDEEEYDKAEDYTTQDKVYLLSVDEMVNEAYGFTKGYQSSDERKLAELTLYAAANGVDFTGFCSGGWWLRSEGEYSTDACAVDYYGYGDDDGAMCDVYGVRPVLQLNLKTYSSLWTYGGKVGSDGTVLAPGESSSGGQVVDPAKKPGAPVRAQGITTWDCVYFGNYWQTDTDGDGSATRYGDEKKPIKWRVLSVEGNKALLLADKALMNLQYDDSREGVTWENSTIRARLNGDDNYYSEANLLKEAFTAEEQNAIIETTLTNMVYTGSGVTEGAPTTDKIFLLSKEDVTNVSYGFDDGKEESWSRIAGSTDYVTDNDGGNLWQGLGDWWWLRSVMDNGQNVGFIDYNSFINFYDCDSYYCAVRPALYLDLSKDSLWTYAGTVSTRKDWVYPGSSQDSGNGGSGGNQPGDNTENGGGNGGQGNSPSTDSGNQSGSGTDNSTVVTPTPKPEENQEVVSQEPEKITVDAPVIKSSKNVKGAKVNIVLKKLVKDAKGYEVRYSTDKKMKAAKKVSVAQNKVSSGSITISKLKKKKTYYIQVRAYKTSEGQKIFSKWSSAKQIKVKK